MTRHDPGALLFEYRPPRAHPIVYAGFLVFAFVLLTGSIEVLLRGGAPSLLLVYSAPLLATLLLYVAFFPSDVRIHAHGIAPSRPLVLRWHRPFVRWDGLAAVYPCHYDVTGALVSPFASSDGKVTQFGLGLEWPDGRVETVRFTPSRFVAWRPSSAGFKGAIEVVRDLFAQQGRPLVPNAPTYSEGERERLLAEARAPFLPFFAIVILFASAAPVLWVLAVPVGLPVAWALPLSLAPPVWVSLRSFTRSRRRNRILNALSKADEHARGRPGAAPPTDAAGAPHAHAAAAPPPHVGPGANDQASPEGLAGTSRQAARGATGAAPGTQTAAQGAKAAVPDGPRGRDA